MPNYDYYLFDFDGTICNTATGIYKSMEQVCKHYNLNYAEDTFKKMIGPSLKESFSTIFHIEQSEIQNAIKVYRDYYSTVGMFLCEPYEDIAIAIKMLKSYSKKIFVATSKPELYTKQIIKQKNLIELFDFVGGADLTEETRVEKVDVINYVLESNNLLDKKDKCLMIGDRLYDIQGAKKAGIASCGVCWGFGSKEELLTAGADFIIDNPKELINL